MQQWHTRLGGNQRSISYALQASKQVSVAFRESWVCLEERILTEFSTFGWMQGADVNLLTSSIAAATSCCNPYLNCSLIAGLNKHRSAVVAIVFLSRIIIGGRSLE
jgi:hypothetical protein